MTRRENDGQRPGGGTSPRRDSAARRTTRRPARPPAAPPETPDQGDDGDAADSKSGRQRIAKLMARVGLCSRRDAESWIVDGRVSLNGTVLTSPAVDVGEDDRVLVDGAPLPAADKTRLFLFHKPRGLITSDHDPEGRATIFDHLRGHWPDGPRVVTVGRLDINTEGLLLLTNDGGLARVLELPQTGWVRRYRVRAKGETDQAVLDRLADGVTIEGIDYAGIEAKLDRVQGANCWLTMGLREGKNREVKRVLEHIGLEVNRLIRLSFGPFQLLDLPEGEVSEVRTRILRDQLGPFLAAQAGVDFTDIDVAPIVAAPARTSRAGARDATARPRTDRKADDRQTRDRKSSDRQTGDRKTSDHKTGARDSSSTPRGRNFRERDRDDEVLAPEKRERPTAGPRKHVATMRAETAVASRTGPRKRLERTDTTDRKNRAVVVERLVSQAPVVSETVARRRERPVSSAPVRRERPSSFERRERPATGLGPGRTIVKEGRESRSALGKRERVARSGGATRERPVSTGAERNEERPPRRDRADARPARPFVDKPERTRDRDDAAKRTRTPTVRAFPARPARGRDEARPARGRDEARPARGRDEARPARGRDEARPARGRDEARPARGRDETRPARGRDDARPARGRDDARPARSRGETRPARGRDDARPARSRDETRPARSRDETRPARSRDETRPARSRDETRPARSRPAAGAKSAASRPPRTGAGDKRGGKPARPSRAKPTGGGDRPPRRPRS